MDALPLAPLPHPHPLRVMGTANQKRALVVKALVQGFVYVLHMVYRNVVGFRAMYKSLNKCWLSRAYVSFVHDIPFPPSSNLLKHSLHLVAAAAAAPAAQLWSKWKQIETNALLRLRSVIRRPQWIQPQRRERHCSSKAWSIAS